MSFVNTLFWEFVQNVGLGIAVLGLWLWRRGNRWIAGGVLLVAGLYTAFAIFLTEWFKIGIPGSVSGLVVNVIGIATLTGIVLLNLEKGNARLDWLIGLVLGILLASAQGVAVSNRYDFQTIVVHAVALALAVSVILSVLRALVRLPLWQSAVGSLALVVTVTIIIGLIDYGYLLK